ncbi:hypothetical protein BpHYR1_029028 [Brachionus plicatilis]|uniref:Uncharacterized protein n=1 Tax=Brachionus plicatilis TaxID=10195 RepID=A0A3M7SWJ8_BRAPC|nr:hypothetical protein BpHYR1_029028 [Brachionus plicatilis]
MKNPNKILLFSFNFISKKEKLKRKAVSSRNSKLEYYLNFTFLTQNSLKISKIKLNYTKKVYILKEHKILYMLILKNQNIINHEILLKSENEEENNLTHSDRVRNIITDEKMLL